MKAPAPGAPPICVYCRRHPVDPLWRPFCSERCKLQDLAAWAGGAYRVGGDTDDALDEDTVEDEKAEGKR